MRALAYECRRLTGVGSTWLVLAGTLAGSAAFTAVTAHQGRTAPGSYSVEQAVSALTALPAWLPLPLAAFAAGLLGALSYGHELRYPALCPALVSTRRRLRLLGAKLCVIAVAAMVLGSGTVLVNATVLRFASPADTPWSDLPHLPPQHLQGLPFALLGSLVPVVAAGWVALLAAGLLRSTTAGVLVLLGLAALPTVAEPLVVTLVRFSGADHSGFGEALSARLAVTVLPAVVLLLAWVSVHLRRRTV